MLAERDAEIALSPGIRWGGNAAARTRTSPSRMSPTLAAMTYPNCYRMTMTGARLKEILEDVADNIFNPDPYYQQGGDMVRTGGLGFTIDISAKAGSRISGMTLLKSGAAARCGPRLRGRRLGQHQRGHRRAADLGRGGQAPRQQEDGRPQADRRGQGAWAPEAPLQRYA